LVSRGMSLRAEPQVFWHRDCGLLGRAVDKRKEEHGMFKRSLIQLLILGFIVSLPTGWVVGSEKSIASKVSRAEENFVKDAAAGGMMEVELGKMAAEKATNDKVKAFGRQMQQDHGKANRGLRSEEN